MTTPTNLDAAVADAARAYCERRASFGEASIAKTRAKSPVPMDPTTTALLDAIFARYGAKA